MFGNFCGPKAGTHATAEDLGSVPGWGTRIPQISSAAKKINEKSMLSEESRVWGQTVEDGVGGRGAVRKGGGKGHPSGRRAEWTQHRHPKAAAKPRPSPA